MEDVQLNGHPTQRLPHNLSIFIPGVESRSLVVKLKHDLSHSSGTSSSKRVGGTPSAFASRLIVVVVTSAKGSLKSRRIVLYATSDLMCSFVIDMLRSLATSLTFNLNLMRAAYTLPCLDGSQCVMVLLFKRY